ncbi:MAG: hypothetical protein BalsKO_09430 [Balneolaceae bacterium]
MIKYFLKFLLISFLLFSFTEANAQQVTEVQTLILEGSKLRINGTSNVNDFECIYSDRISTDTLHQQISYGDSLFIAGESIRLLASSFDCGKRAINRDMQKTLKADEFPFLEIGLKSIEIADEVPFVATLSVTIAGKNRLNQIHIDSFSGTDTGISFSGKGAILLTDYGLKPPTALFGLVKVDDQIEIIFDLSVEQ